MHNVRSKSSLMSPCTRPCVVSLTRRKPGSQVETWSCRASTGTKKVRSDKGWSWRSHSYYPVSQAECSIFNTSDLNMHHHVNAVIVFPNMFGGLTNVLKIRQWTNCYRGQLLQPLLYKVGFPSCWCGFWWRCSMDVEHVRSTSAEVFHGSNNAGQEQHMLSQAGVSLVHRQWQVDKLLADERFKHLLPSKYTEVRPRIGLR